MSRSDHGQVSAQQTRRAATTARRKIGSSGPEGLGVACPHCGAVAGKSLHGPMT